jgi:hypothetical protein
MAVMYGLIYFRLEVNQEGIQNINGVLFMFLINSTFGVLYTVVNVNIKANCNYEQNKICYYLIFQVITKRTSIILS